MLDIAKIEKGLELLIKLPSLTKELPTLPNINFLTMGGEVFWNDLAEVKG